MRRAFIVVSILLTASLAGYAQSDKLEGRWTGTVDGLQGKQAAAATFKKDGDKYTGTITGMRPGMDASLKEVKVDGDKVTAKTELDTPQGNIVINYAFVV